MQVQTGARTCIRGAPKERLDEMGHRDLEVHQTLHGRFDYVHLFATSIETLDVELPRLRRHLRPTGALWVSWPKGGRQHGDLTLQRVIERAYRHGLVESTTISVDAAWSAIKLTHPKPGRITATASVTCRSRNLRQGRTADWARSTDHRCRRLLRRDVILRRQGGPARPRRTSSSG